ncbi:MAG: cupin domain-containing protein [Nitrospinota bacterium]
MEHVNALENREVTEGDPNKVVQMKTDELSGDTYYFSEGQVLEYHRHPTGDQIFFVHEGEGDFFLDPGTEEKVSISPGSIVLAPKNVWHKVVNTGSGILVVSQATKQPAGMEKR